MDALARARPRDLLVDEHDDCWTGGLLFHRNERWNVLDAESEEALVEDDPTFAVPVSFTPESEPQPELSETPALVRGTWHRDGIRTDVPAGAWVNLRRTGRPRAAGWRPMTHDAALALVELQTAGVVTGVEDPASLADRRRVYVTDPDRVRDVVEVFAPEQVTIRSSPWSAQEWLGASAILDRLRHLVGFADDVEEGAPRMLLWLTRVDRQDLALLERLPAGLACIRQVLVQPMRTWPG